MYEVVPDTRSRRGFLRLTLAALGGTAAASLLAACGQPSSAPSGAAPAAPKAAPPTAAPAAGAATPTPGAAAKIANPTPTPYPVANYGAQSAKVSIRYWTILGSVDGIIMNDLVRKFAEANPDIRVESLQGVTDFVTKMEAAAIS